MVERYGEFHVLTAKARDHTVILLQNWSRTSSSMFLSPLHAQSFRPSRSIMQSPVRPETGTGVRQTMEKAIVKLPVSPYMQKEKLQELVRIPPSFLPHEPERRRERALDFWNRQILKTMVKLIRTRKSRMGNKHLRIVVFRSGMQKLLAEFNRMTENIKVEFREKHNKHKSPSYEYSLDFY